jgi:hypothetical protein
MSWLPRPALGPASPDRDPRSRWLIFADQQGVAVELVQRLEGLAQKCQMVYPDWSLEVSDGEKIVDRVIDAALAEHQDYRGVIYLWGLDHHPISGMTP